MAFNITAAVPPVLNFTVTAGAQSAILGWSPLPYPVEIRRGGVLIANAAANASGYTDGGLPADVAVTYGVRVRRTFSTGRVAFGTTATATATPALAEIGLESVGTENVAPNAITSRTTYEETGNEYVSYGTDSGGGTTNPGDEVWTLADIPFTGDGNVQVITCICRQSETPVYFRLGNSSVWASVEARIINLTTDTVVDVEELTVAGIRVEQQGVGPDAWLTFAHHRDFNHSFVVPTVEGDSYAVRFKLSCGADDPTNYILWASTLRQVFWQIYKR